MVAEFIKVIGEGLIKLLPFITAYIKGRQDEKNKTLERANAVLVRQNQAASSAACSRADIIKRMHDGEL